MSSLMCGSAAGCLRLHLEVWNYHVAVESGKVDHRTKISRLLGDQKQLALVPEGCHVGDPLYGPLQQQGIHILLEVLPAVSGPEADALMGELRSLMESDAHPGWCPVDSSTVGQSPPGEPPPGPRKRRPAAEAEEVFLVLLR